MNYLIPRDPTTIEINSNEIYPRPLRDGAYSDGVEEYTVSYRPILFWHPANVCLGCLTEGSEGKDHKS